MMAVAASTSPIRAAIFSRSSRGPVAGGRRSSGASSEAPRPTGGRGHTGPLRGRPMLAADQREGNTHQEMQNADGPHGEPEFHRDVAAWASAVDAVRHGGEAPDEPSGP